MVSFINLLSPGSRGVAINGPQDYAQIGVSVSSAGDFNGDGYEDFIFTGPVTDAVNNGRGVTYLIFGKAGGIGAINLAALSASQGFAIYGDPSGFTGDKGVDMVAARAGDVNGDGYDDIVIGAPRNSLEGNWAGRAYIVYGHSGGFGTLDLGTMTAQQGATIFQSPYIGSGSNGPFLGVSVAAVGDVNGDGYDDVIVGSENDGTGGDYAGAAYLLFGSSSGIGNMNVANGSPTQLYKFTGTQPAGFAGHDVAGLGDINGDGIDDFAIGIPNVSRVVVRFGLATGSFSGGLTPNAAQGFVINGIDGTGWSISSAGDVNGDGYVDILVADSRLLSESEAYLLWGQAGGFGTIDLTSLTAAQGFRIDRTSAVAGKIGNVSAAGDVNGDGYDDFMVGIVNNSASGSVYLIYGAPVLSGVELGVTDGLVLQTGTTNDSLGESLGAADVNSDGFTDLLVGAWRANAGGFARGSAFLIYGELPVGSVTHTGSIANQTLAGGNGDDTLNGMGGDDELRGNGGNDRLDGGTGADAMYGGSGDDVFVVDNAGDQAIELAGEGNDTIETTLTTYILPEGSNIEKVKYVGGLPFHGRGNSSGNILEGGITSDSLVGLGGADTLIGGHGNDYLYSAGSYSGATFNERDDGAEHDILQGDGGSDYLSIGWGDDADGGGLADTLSISLVGAGAGVTLNTADLIAGTPFVLGGGTIRNIEGISTIWGTAFDDDLTLASSTTVYGGLGNDRVTALGGGATFYTGGGSDTFVGGAGNDTVRAESLDSGDSFDGGGGTDTLHVANGSNISGLTLTSFEIINAGDVTLTLAQLDALIQFSGIFRLTTSGTLDLTGVLASGHIYLAPTGDNVVTLPVGPYALNVWGGAGNDTITGGATGVIDGGGGNDTVTGALSTQNYLWGGAGNDLVTGGNVNDTLFGGLGVDDLRAGSGDDQFQFGSAADAEAGEQIDGGSGSTAARAMTS
jgi:Ca2+-binding RTX toxin-like protein